VLALPGALPVMNKAALDAIIKAGLLLGCEIAPVCKWDRKRYFYPDSPKNYQISQYDQPICIGGSVEIELPGEARNLMGEHKRIPLTRIHLEEDVGKLNHHATDSLVDYNRAGTPLMEIVSEPAMHTADEAFAYLTAIAQHDDLWRHFRLRHGEGPAALRRQHLDSPRGRDEARHEGRAEESQLDFLCPRRHRPRDQAAACGRRPRWKARAGNP